MRIPKIQFYFSLLLLIMPAYSYTVYAEVAPLAPSIVVNELQMNGSGAKTTDQEFIELKNTSDLPVNIAGWSLQYVSSTGNLATAKKFVTFPELSIINPGGFLLTTPDTYLVDIAPKTTYVINSGFGGMAATGGSLMLLNELGITVDLVGWGTKSTTIGETELAIAPVDGYSIQRKIVDAKTVDTNNNKNDFEQLLSPSPETANNPPEVIPIDLEAPPSSDTTPIPVDPMPVPDPQPDPVPPAEQPLTSETEATNQAPVATPPAERPILLNELFIDPASPLTDSADEWVELYNPNDSAQDLSNYTVFAGETYAYHHTFPDGVILPAHGYISLTSADTSLALANGGGSVKITGPNGTVYDQTTYQSAKTGYAWAKDASGTWQWTSTPTKDADNQITVIPDTVKAVAAAVSAAKKTTAKTVAKKTTTSKASATKAGSAAKTTKVKAVTDSANEPNLVAAPTPLPVWLLAVLGVLAVLYSAYEYRFDLTNKIYQFRANRAARAANR